MHLNIVIPRPTGIRALVIGFCSVLLHSPIGRATESVNAEFSATTSAVVTAASYTASSKSVNLSLNFAPPTGTSLTVVNNTGIGFISGTFSNLGQGQSVTLAFDGISYPFAANYYGGTGNDLVLQWANVRPMALGKNLFGQLGNNSTTQAPVPVAVDTSGVLAGKTVVSVSAGFYHSLALCADGTLAAWGYNSHGQLGSYDTTGSSVPVAVDQSGVLAGRTVVAVAAGAIHSLALCADGMIAAWGHNGNGQLGNNSKTASLVPVAVDTSGVLAGKTVVALSAGNGHSLALCSDGMLVAWGSNAYGLGNSGSTNSTVPVAVSQNGVLAGKSVVAVAAGSFHCLALCSDGTLAAWGSNFYGELGNGSRDSSQHKVPLAMNQSGVLNSKQVIAVAAGGSHNLVLCSDGTMVAWGDNGVGQLGNNSTSNNYVPVAVDQSGVLTGKTVIAVAAGYLYSLAQCKDGTLAAWGDNYYGQLGNNSTTDSSVPVSNSPLDSGERFVVVGIGSSANHTLMVAVQVASTSGLEMNPVTLTVLPSGHMRLAFNGIPDRTHLIERSTDLTKWQNLATLTADSTGAISYIDESPPTASAFYRLGMP